MITIAIYVLLVIVLTPITVFMALVGLQLLVFFYVKALNKYYRRLH